MHSIIYWTIQFMIYNCIVFITSMLSCIPILTIQRTLPQTLQLIVLCQMIPSKPEDKFIKQKVKRRLLYTKYKNRKIFNSCYRIVAQQMINSYNSMIQEGLLNLECTQDPVGKFFIGAILDKKNWGQLIAQNNWNKLFRNQPPRKKKLWNMYQQWITFIFYKGFQRKNANFLICQLSLYQRNIIKQYDQQLSQNTIINQKFQKWIEKDVAQIEKIHYEFQRNLLISIKLKESFSKTLQRLCLSQILQSTNNPLDTNFNKWIHFLCTKFSDNKPYYGLFISKSSFTWNLIYKFNPNYWHKKYPFFEQKIQSILSNCTNFQESFTNQIEASLLKDLSSKQSWKIAKSHIQDILIANDYSAVKADTTQHNNFNLLKYQKPQTFPLQSKSNDSSKNQDIQETAQVKNDQDSKAQFFPLQNNFTKIQNFQFKSNDFLKNLKNNIKKLQSKTYPLAKNLFKRTDQIKKQSSQKIPKTTNQQNYQNTQKLSQINQYASYQYKTTNSMQFQAIISPSRQQFNFNCQKYPQYQDQQSFILPERQQKVSKSLQSQFFKTSINDSKINTLSTEQKLVLSLILRAHNSLQDFKKKYFSDISEQSLQKYFTDNKQMIIPLHRSILSLYSCNPEEANKISNENIKKLIQTILKLQQLTQKNRLSSSKQDSQDSENREMNSVQNFVTKFDKFVNKIQEKQTFIKKQNQFKYGHQKA